ECEPNSRGLFHGAASYANLCLRSISSSDEECECRRRFINEVGLLAINDVDEDESSGGTVGDPDRSSSSNDVIIVVIQMEKGFHLASKFKPKQNEDPKSNRELTQRQQNFYFFLFLNNCSKFGGQCTTSPNFTKSLSL
ncbi:hypothetical protein DERP_004662, partial [Dermatophagoides pteronyssinus]